MLKALEFLGQVAHALQQFEDAARSLLPNANLADVVKAARAKVEQAAQHPDASSDKFNDALHDFMRDAAEHGMQPGEGHDPFANGGGPFGGSG
jgi:hypothetical protein